MRLENILALTQGSLKNDPSITSFGRIAYEAMRIKRGDLFIAVDSSSIEEAIINGAYGIIFDKPTQISDSEIAWIKVDSVEDAILRLLRFHLIEKELNVYHCDPVTLELAMQVVTSRDFIVVSGSIVDAFKQLWNSEKGTTVLFSSSFTNSALFATYRELPSLTSGTIEIIEQTLFETSFIYNNVFYERQLLSPFFLPHLERLLDFFKSSNIVFRLRSFTQIHHFEPVFTNRNLERKRFGASNKVLVFESDFELVAAEIEFLKKQANWAKIIYLLPANKQTSVDDEDAFYTYRNRHDIIKILKNADFHFALIAGQDKKILEELLPEDQPQQLTLDL